LKPGGTGLASSCFMSSLRQTHCSQDLVGPHRAHIDPFSVKKLQDIITHSTRVQADGMYCARKASPVPTAHLPCPPHAMERLVCPARGRGLDMEVRACTVGWPRGKAARSSTHSTCDLDSGQRCSWFRQACSRAQLFRRRP
jgi:hypothetical protein